ncbi:hypothetical protein H0H87_002712 [Tephrocybe sp. NHM501043]|nr:hypothetical protein H0H87_002712 [Tephrocybe sp. NHM501043]
MGLLDGKEHISFFQVLEELPSLKELSIPRYTANPTLIHSISRLPVLQRVVANNGVANLRSQFSRASEDVPFIVNFDSKSTFLKLTTLFLSGHSTSVLIPIIEHPHFIQDLTALMLEVFGPRLSELLSRTAGACPKITVFALDNVDKEYKTFALGALCPIMALKLTSLTIQCYGILHFTKDDLVDLANSLPSLTVLSLNERPYTDDIESGLQELTILPFIGQLFPTLEWLGLLLDTSGASESEEGLLSPLSSLLQLHIGSSHLASKDLMKVLLFFMDIFPTGVEIILGENYDDEWTLVKQVIRNMKSEYNTGLQDRPNVARIVRILTKMVR